MLIKKYVLAATAGLMVALLAGRVVYGVFISGTVGILYLVATAIIAVLLTSAMAYRPQLWFGSLIGTIVANAAITIVLVTVTKEPALAWVIIVYSALPAVTSHLLLLVDPEYRYFMREKKKFRVFHVNDQY